MSNIIELQGWVKQRATMNLGSQETQSPSPKSDDSDSNAILYAILKLQQSIDKLPQTLLPAKTNSLEETPNNNQKIPELLDKTQIKMRKRVERTAQARFEMSTRLLRTDRMLTVVSSVAAVSTIWLSLIDSNKSFISHDNINIVSILLGIIFIVCSLIISGSEYKRRAISIHSHALSLNKIAHKLKMYNLNKKQIDELNDKYHKILKQQENHEPIDYIRAKYSNKKIMQMMRVMSFAEMTRLLLHWGIVAIVCIFWIFPIIFAFVAHFCIPGSQP